LNSIVPTEQSGFRPNCLVSTRVLSIVQQVQNNLDANEPTLSLYIDYKKAYDRMWHTALIVKLHRSRMRIALLKVVYSWLFTRKAFALHGELVTKEFSISIGFPKEAS
jgi:hypothetical protein